MLTVQYNQTIRRVPKVSSRGSVKESESPNFKGSSQFLSVRLANAKHDRKVEKPPTARLRPSVGEPQPVPAATHTEDTRVAIRVGNGFHAYVVPVTKRLVAVRQTLVGTRFGRTEFKAKCMDASVLLSWISKKISRCWKVPRIGIAQIAHVEADEM